MHPSTLGRLALLLAPALALALPLPVAKDIKFFQPSDDPSVTDLGKYTGRIGIDIVDPSPLRVDPVRALGKRSPAAAAVTDGWKEDDRAVRRAHVRVDPVEVDVHVVRPSPMLMPSDDAPQPEEAGPTGDMPRFKPEYDVDEWVRHY
ncbi:hypothetical protein LZ30DRAFT_727279 [Colletotrichum cereale]|nr:hypothetical protein LZ30DRAFT_727279 [Colletotrichum cereale]